MKEKFSLYSITSELEKVNELLMESFGEMTPEIEEAMILIEAQLTTKTDSIVGYVKSQNDFIGAIDNEIKRLQDGKNRVKKSLDTFNRYVVGCMNKMKKIEIKGDLSKIKIRKPSQVVEILDEKELSLEFVEIVKTQKILKSEIKKALKNGQEVSGAKLTLGKQKAVFS